MAQKRKTIRGGVNMKVLFKFYDFDLGGSDDDCLLKTEVITGTAEEIQTEINKYEGKFDVTQPAKLSDHSEIVFS